MNNTSKVKVMKYISKKKRKVFKKITRTDEGDQARGPYKTGDDTLGKKLETLSRGGKVERSHNKKVGNIINRDLDKRYITNNVLEKYSKRIDNFFQGKKKRKKLKDLVNKRGG